MNIPYSFYIKYWITYSLLALCTGYLISFLIAFLFVAVPYFGLIICLLYQVIIFRYFWGERRGDFEYAFKENKIKKESNRLVRQSLGWHIFISFSLDSLSYGWDVFKKMSAMHSGKDNKAGFYINMIAADLSRKEDDFQKEIRYLEKAVADNPDELVSNFRLAVAMEGDGRSEAAIRYYNAALTDPSLTSIKLRDFILSQIDRVKKMGPRKNPPIPGLKFGIW